MIRWYRLARARGYSRRRALRMAWYASRHRELIAARFVAALDEAAGERSKLPRRSGEPDIDYYRRVKTHLGIR